MKSVVVFSDNRFVEVRVPEGLEGEELVYATFFCSFLQKGWDEAKARRVAEAAVYKRLYPGLGYGKMLEGELKELYSHSFALLTGSV